MRLQAVDIGNGRAEASQVNEESFDFAVAGNSAFAAMLSLALARTRKRKVCLIGQLPGPLQISRDIALSPGPTSHPETLELLKSATGDLRSLLSGPGEPVLMRRNVTFAALTAPGRAAAGHARHLLATAGVVTAPLPETASLYGFIAEGIWVLRPRVFFAGLKARLSEAGVVAVETAEDLQIGRNRVRFAYAHTFAEARTLIVTDASHAGILGALPAGIATGKRIALLTDPVPGLAGRILVDIETGGHVAGRSDGRLEAIVPADDDSDLVRWLGAFLPPDTTARVIARTRFPVLLSRDGAPAVMRLPRRAAMLAIGFGVSGPFLAPALARFLTETAQTGETAWFSARSTDSSRSRITDIGVLGGGLT